MLGRYDFVGCVERAVGAAESVLDVGCGNNSPIGRFRRRPPYSVGVDLFEPFIEESRRRRFHDEYKLMDVRDIDREFRTRSFDVVIACDLLEHLERDDGRSLLGKMESIARERVVVVTPNGFVPQGETWSNPYQRHRSGWGPDDMRRHGYELFGLNGLRILHGERGLPRWRPARAWSLVSELTKPFVFTHPGYAFHLLCIKHIASSAR